MDQKWDSKVRLEIGSKDLVKRLYEKFKSKVILMLKLWLKCWKLKVRDLIIKIKIANSSSITIKQRLEFKLLRIKS